MAARRAALHIRRSSCPRIPSRSSVSSAVLEDNRSANIQGDARTTFANDIPVMVLPHSAKKAFKVHSKLRTLQPLDKVSWLTKTICQEGIPDNILMEAAEPSEELENAFRDAVWHHAGAQRPRSGHSLDYHENRGISRGPLLDYLRIALSQDSQSNPLGDYFIDLMPNVQTHWFRNFQFFHTDPANKQDLVLRTARPSCHVEEVEGCAVEDPSDLPGPYDSYSLSTFLHPFVKLTNSPGYFHAQHNAIPYPHTVLTSFKDAPAAENVQAHAVLTLFLQLHAYALSIGQLPGTGLVAPMVANCIVTTGSEMVFCIYQLNTLSMIDDLGMWNKAWITPPLKLFTSQKGKDRGFRESAGSDGLLDYDPDCLRHMMALLFRNGSQR